MGLNSGAANGGADSALHLALPTAPSGKHLLPWLLLALVAHAVVLAPDALSFRAQGATAPPLQWRLLVAPAAPAEAPQSAKAEAGPAHVPESQPSTTRTDASPARPSAPPSAPLAAPPQPERGAATAAQAPPAGQWTYQLRWQGEQGVARIEWAQDGSRYRLHLTRQTTSKSLPDWTSEGELRAGGLQPLRFSTQRGKRSQLALSFDPAAGTIAVGKQASTPAPALTQDRLSWMFQAAAMAQATQLKPGTELQFWVAGWRGDLQAWRMRAEPDPQHPQWLRLRRLPPEGSLVEQSLWLDPARHHLPVRMEVRWDDAERWELQLDDTPIP
jgi:hypothetical protein